MAASSVRRSAPTVDRPGAARTVGSPRRSGLMVSRILSAVVVGVGAAGTLAGRPATAALGTELTARSSTEL